MAVGLLWDVSDGQMLWQAPVQLLMSALSRSNRYSVRPLASTRTLPSDVLRRPTAELAAAGAGAVAAPPPYAPLDGWVVVDDALWALLDPLLVIANTIPASAARNTIGMR